MSVLTSGLNEQQRAAVTAGDGPVLVLAGPGSGKTRVLTYRLAYLLREVGVVPGAIVAVTFTNKAAGEMRHRIETLLEGRIKGLTIGTFHAICARLLRRESEHTDRRADFLIYDTDDQISVVTQALNDLNLDSKKFHPRRMLNTISSAKNELIAPDQFRGRDYFGEIAGRVYQRYQELLISSNARDFDDLLMDTVMLFRDQPEVLARYQRFYEYLLVDEFQDTNAAQYLLVRQLGEPQNNIFVVGDEDQAIYGFRGADYRNVLQFRHDFPAAQVILLEQNYRSTQIVLDAARAVIDQNTQRTPKALFTERTGGEKIALYEAYSEQEEAEYVVTMVEKLRRKESLAYRDFSVMYRTNAQSRALEEAFIREQIPYKLVGGVGFYKRREIRDLLAYLRLINNPDDSVSFGRIINVPKRGIGKKTVDDFNVWLAKQRIGCGAGLEALVNGETAGLGASVVKKLVEFARMMQEWRALAAKGDLLALLDDILSRTGFTLYLHESSDTPEEARDREDNVQELRGVLGNRKETPLNEFLEEIALVSDVDSLAESADAVTLLTLHAAKGLEYPVVFLTGLEDGVLPHIRALDEPDGVEEERRLMYVGITRAMHHLYLTYAFRRTLYGESNPSTVSRFLRDIPTHLIDGMSTRLAQTHKEKRYYEDTSWEPTQPAPKVSKRSQMMLPLGDAPKTRFRSGQRVRHAKFGDGVVVESQVRAGDEEVVVSFKSVGVKRLAASFANLVMLDE